MAVCFGFNSFFTPIKKLQNAEKTKAILIQSTNRALSGHNLKVLGQNSQAAIGDFPSGKVILN